MVPPFADWTEKFKTFPLEGAISLNEFKSKTGDLDGGVDAWKKADFPL